jgi:catechol 1,2-dioxygenase
VRGQVVDGAGAGIANARVHVYQTDASGRYTPDRPMDEPHARLAGWLRTDAHGRFDLHTIRPGGYPRPIRLGDRDRKIPAHIHMDLTASGYAPRRLQVVFADDPLLADEYWKNWVREQRHPVLSVRQFAAEQTADLVISLNPDTPR